MLISILNAQNRKTGTYTPKLYAAKIYASKTGRVQTIISKIKFYHCRKLPLRIYLKYWRGPKRIMRGVERSGLIIWVGAKWENYFCPATASSRSLIHCANLIRVS